MFKVETVIILGAVASMPYDFPSGKDLKFAISDALNWGVDMIRNGNDLLKTPLIHRAMREYKFSEQAIAFFANDLNTALQPSIDSFLEIYTDYIEMGKIGIAASLIPHESPDQLINIDRKISNGTSIF